MNNNRKKINKIHNVRKEYYICDEEHASAYNEAYEAEYEPDGEYDPNYDLDHERDY